MRIIMKKILFRILLIFLFAVSCHREDIFVIPDVPEMSTIGKTVFYTADDEALTFLPSRDSSAWTSLIGLQTRFDACLVPENVLDRMTTEALVASAMNYPLNYIIFAYNNPQTAVDLIFENSSLHRELASRPDAPAELTKLFAASTSGFEIQTKVCDDTKQLSYRDEMFLEYLIGSDRIAGRLNQEYKSMLRNAVSLKIQERLSDSLTYSMTSIEPLEAIDKAEELFLTSVDTKSGEVIGTITVYTPFHQEILGYIRNELTYSEINEFTNYVTSNYPNAVIHGPATSKYNCHSYAWYSNDINNRVWINAYYEDENDDEVNQLEYYWTNDLYVSCSENQAIRAHYSEGDHSAIVQPNGRYLSKWGSYPLVEHDKTDCPFITENINFYKYITFDLNVSGKTPVNMNESNFYYAGPYYSGLTYEWDVRFMDAPEPKPCDFIKSSDFCYRLVCRDYGYFKIVVNAKYRGTTIGYGQFGVTAYGF